MNIPKCLAMAAVVLAAPSFTAAQTALKASSEVNVRTGPGTGYASMGRVPAGQVYVGASLSGDWWKVWYDGRVGYTNRSFWTSLSGQTGVKVTGDVVNVRTGAGTSYALAGKAYLGQIYYWLNLRDGWYEIFHGSRRRWIKAEFVTRVSLSGSGSTQPPSSNITNLNMEYGRQVTNYFCGPATVQLVARYTAGTWYSQWTISSYLGTNSWSGTDVGALGRGLRRYANSGYLTATYFNRDRVVRNIGLKFPVAINFQGRYLSYIGQSLMHYSPIKGYTSGGFYIHDTAFGPNKWASSTEVRNAVNYHTAYYYPRY